MLVGCAGLLPLTPFRYKNFRATYYAKCPRFLSFEGDTAVYGLSFSDTTEADNFKAHLDKRAAGESQS